jgi:uncharacterized membrane protein YtjA (UPF0391 family)
LPRCVLDFNGNGRTAKPQSGYQLAGIGRARAWQYNRYVPGSATAVLDSDARGPDAVQGGFMLRWALAFFVVALVAAVFGFLGIAVAAAGIARILFFIFLVLFLVSLVGGLLRRA